MDHDSRDGIALDFWQAHPEVPEPEGFRHRTRDGRRILDYCTHTGYPITFLMEEGRVTADRVSDGIISIRISRGPGLGLTLTVQHVSLDIDPSTPGVQYLQVGSIVHRGDLVAHTDRVGIGPGSDSSTAVGVFGHSGYHPDQEMMLIGPDGQPNILYEP